MDDNSQPDSNVAQYNGKIIAASLGMLCLVVFFIFALHIYARWFWRVSARRQAFLWRGRSGEQAGGEPVASASEGGLDKALVDAMPTFLYHAGHAGQDCAVCLCEFQENEKGRLLPNCKHSFHTGCIDAWFLSHTTCPLCRAGAAPPSPSPSPSSFLCSNGGPESALQATQDEQAQDPQQAREPEETQPDLEANLRGEEEGPGLPQPSSSLPSSGWRWAGFSRSHHAVQFPTNVLFWGDHSHVTSRVSSPTLQHGQRGGRSLPHTLAMTLDPTRAQGSYGAEQSPAPDLRQQEDPLSKFPVARLSAIKRLLSCRERRVFPSSSSEQEAPSTSIDLRA